MMDLNFDVTCRGAGVVLVDSVFEWCSDVVQNN